jgi:hypothetical protein
VNKPGRYPGPAYKNSLSTVQSRKGTTAPCGTYDFADPKPLRAGNDFISNALAGLPMFQH